MGNKSYEAGDPRYKTGLATVGRHQAARPRILSVVAKKTDDEGADAARTDAMNRYKGRPGRLPQGKRSSNAYYAECEENGSNEWKIGMTSYTSIAVPDMHDLDPRDMASSCRSSSRQGWREGRRRDCRSEASVILVVVEKGPSASPGGI
jgi:hypothetical protein